MRTKLLRFFWATLLALTLAQAATAYTYIYADDNHPVRWLPGSIPMHIKLGFGATSDGLNYSGSMQAAMTAWNSNLSTVQFQPVVEAQGSGTDSDGATQVFFSNTIYGTSFDSSTLAITLVQWVNNETIEADMIFNTAYAWDSYRGNRTSGQPYDIQRVALHELGHVLGLDHPDQATDGSDTSVVAIMRSVVSNSSGPGYDSLAPDDILGAQNLYGASGGAAPANDNFANAPAITLVNGFGQAAGSNIYPNSATRESGEPLIVGNAGGHSVWWKWTATASGTATIDTRGSLFDTILGVYTGSAVNDLTLVADNDDEDNPGGIITSLVTFNAIGGTTYYIAVDGFYYPPANNYFPGEAGKIQLHISQTAGGGGPMISNPLSVTVGSGGTAQFSVAATGTPTPNLQWQRQPAAGGGFNNLGNSTILGVTYSGVTTATLTVSNPTTTTSGEQYRCVATNSAGTATSAAAVLTVLPPPPIFVGQPHDSTVNEGENTSFIVGAQVGFGESVIFAWQVLPPGGSNWTAVADGNGYSGSTTFNLSLTNVPFALNGYSYRCVAGLASNPTITATSSVAVLTVNRAYGVVRTAGGDLNGFLIRMDGTLSAMGYNSTGALGDGGGGPARWSPWPIASNVVCVSTSGRHTLFIRADATLWATGSNSWGQLGDGNSGTLRQSPVQVASGVVAAYAGNDCSYFIKSDGSLWAMGDNSHHKLGDGTTIQRTIPVQVATDVVSVSSGGEMMFFLKADGTAWSVGDYNPDGQLGNGTTNPSLTPAVFATNVVAIAAGARHGMILKSDGSVWTFGNNQAMQIGDGTNISRYSPVQIASGVKLISAFSDDTYFIKTDGTLWTNGWNYLGNGTVNGTPTPVLIASGVVEIAAGSHYVGTDGSLWGWGFNSSGSVGDGTNTARLLPVKVAFGATQSPSAPTNLSAVASTGFPGSLRLTWSTAIGTSRYEVWRNSVNTFSSATRLATNIDPALFYDLAPISGTSYYWVVAINPAGSTVSNSLIVVTTASPQFTTQPIAQWAQTTGTVTFTAAASGPPTPTLQWQRLAVGGGSWADLSNGGSYSGVTTATLTVSAATLGMNGDQFRCVATNSVGSATSNRATLTVHVPVAGDFNTDGQKDIVWENTATGERALWLMHGTMYSGGVSFGIIDPAWRAVGADDFNGDGKPDILWENTSTGDRMVWMMDGVNHVSTVDMGIVSTAWRMAALADFNGDHQTDIMLENTSTGERVVWLMNGTDVASTISYGTIPTAWRIAASADFNHDGQIDLVWENTQTGQHAIWLMNGTIFQSAIDFGSIPTQWRLATVGDFDGDGDVDFFWENTTTGDRALWLMHGTIFSTSIYFGIIPTDWDIAP